MNLLSSRKPLNPLALFTFLLSTSVYAVAPDAGGDILASNPAGGATAIAENDPAPVAANIRITPATLNDADAGTPDSIRLISIDGGTITQGDGSPIVLGASGTELALSLGGFYDARFTPALGRDTPATIQYVVVDPETVADSVTSEISVNITPLPTITVSPQVSGDSTPTLSGTVSSTAATISITVDGQIHAATNNGDGTWTLADNTINPALSNGTYDVVASATDVGTATDATSNELTIDNTVPLISINSRITSDTRPELSGTVSSAVATISISVDGQTHAAVNNGNGTWTLADDTINPGLADDIYAVVASATDGGTGTDATVNELTIDTTNPTITIDNITTNDQRPLLSGTISEPTATVTIDVGGQSGLAATNNGDGTWTLADDTISPSLPDNVYDVSATATDAAANVGTDATANELTIDTVVPAITVDPLTSNDSSPALSGTVNDATATITIDVDGQVGLVATNNGATWMLADNVITALTDGIHSVTARATDAAGNVGIDGTANELTLDAGPPEFSVALNGSNPNSDASLQFDLTFSEDVFNVTANDFVVASTSTATITNLITTDASHYSLVVSGGDLAGFVGTVGIDVNPARDIADALGNVLAATEPAVDPEFDHILPNQAPVLSGINGVSIDIETTLSGAPFTANTLSNNDSDEYDGGTIRIVQNTGAGAGNWALTNATVSAGGDSTISASETILVSAVNIGTVGAAEDGQAGNVLTIHLNAQANSARIQQLLTNLIYRPVATIENRSFTLTVNDNNGTDNGGVESVSVNFDLNVIASAPAPTPPTDPIIVAGSTISGDLVNNGTLLNIAVDVGATVRGGSLSGTIDNNGSISDVHLLPGANINGGTVGGSIQGTAGFPATVNAVFSAGTFVDNIVFGPDAVIPIDIELGRNVRFSAGTVIPPGLDLTPLFPVLSAAENSAITALDLETLLIVGGETVLSSIGSTSGLEELFTNLEQDRDTGELLLEFGNMQSRLWPVLVSQPTVDQLPGVSVNSDGEVVVLTDDGLLIVAIPALESLAALEAAASSIEYIIETDDKANIRLSQSDGIGPVFVVRPGISTAPSTQEPGIYSYPLSNPDNLTGTIWVFEDVDGTLKQQELFAAPANWLEFKSAISTIAGVDDISLGVDGIITLEIDNVTYHAQADIQLNSGMSGSSGQLEIVPTGDRNGDGIEDYRVVYSDGTEQVFYLF